MMNHYAQGDVTLVPIECLPSDCQDAKTTTVAYGEATGHHHTFQSHAKVLKAGNGTLFVQVQKGGAVLEHQEHPPLTVEPGLYEVRIAREYQWGEEHRVMD